MKIRSVWADLFHADRQTDATNIIVTFRDFANAPTKKNFGNVICLRICCFMKCTYTTHTFLKLRPAAKTINKYRFSRWLKCCLLGQPFLPPPMYILPPALSEIPFKRKSFLSLPAASRYAYITHICIRRLATASGPAYPGCRCFELALWANWKFGDLIAAALMWAVGLDWYR